MGMDYYRNLGKNRQLNGGIVCLYKDELNVTKIQPPFEIKSYRIYGNSSIVYIKICHHM